MKCTIPEISWHNRDPILTADIQYNSGKEFYRLATGGTDTHVVIWQLNILENGGVSVEMLSDLTRHSRAVNAVRFSPNGQLLASSDDEAVIILWKKSEEFNELFEEEAERENKEHWTIYKMLRSHIEDVYDLSWSNCSQFLGSGSVDNTAIMWDIQKGKSMAILNDHKGFVQGVSWDPKGQYVATLSSDRCFRIFNINNKKVVHRISKMNLPKSPENGEQEKTTRLFYDDTLKSFCRRLSFSPDGELVVAPSGILEGEDGKQMNVAHVFLRSCLNRPVICLPTNDKYTLAVRFCPQLFELREKISSEDSKESAYVAMLNLPYRMVFAVATQNAVLIYDTQQPIPFAKVSNIHYTRLSDISWSSDGRLLIVSSTDGYCSLVSFSEGELGKPYSVSKDNENNDEGLITGEPENDSEETANAVSSESSEVLMREVRDETVNTEEESTETLSSKEQSNEKLNSKEECSAVVDSSELLESKESLMEVDEVPVKESSSSNFSPKVRNLESKTVSVIPASLIKRKPGKRVELTTISVGNSKSNSSSDQMKEIGNQNSSQKNLEATDEVKVPLPHSEEVKASLPRPPRVEGASASPSSKTPRRVSLITLSSPKSKKSDNMN